MNTKWSIFIAVFYYNVTNGKLQNAMVCRFSNATKSLSILEELTFIFNTLQYWKKCFKNTGRVIFGPKNGLFAS